MKKFVILAGALLIFLTACSQESGSGKEETCSMKVDCQSALTSEELSESMRDVLPEDGILFFEEELAFEEGETAFDLLKREMTEAGIHLEFTYTPMYGSYYINGIGNLYEGACGEMSGWTYLVNGESPDVSCSDAVIEAGDEIVFVYADDLMAYFSEEEAA